MISSDSAAFHTGRYPPGICDTSRSEASVANARVADTYNTAAFIPEADMMRDYPAKILIVEDEAILAMWLQDQLADLGYGILASVGSGEQVVQLAVDFQPDLVLMDIKLNGQIDGVEAARQIRERSAIPVVFMSAYSDVDTVQSALLAHPAKYLVKPVLMESLNRVIQDVLQA